MSIEAMKQALEALEKSQSALAEELSAWDIDPPLHHVQESHDLCGPAITSLRQAIAKYTDLDAICQDLQEKTYTQAMRIAELEAKLKEKNT